MRSNNTSKSTEINPKTSRITTSYDPILGFVSMEFYNALERALHNYLKSKLRIETSDFSKDKVRELLNDKKIGLTDLEGFVSVLTSCEIARYTPLSSVDMENDFEKAAQVIIKLDKQLK